VLFCVFDSDIPTFSHHHNNNESMRFTPHLLPSRSGNLGIMLLNNPKALNALSLEMLQCMQDVLDEWTSQPAGPRAILLKANTEDCKIASFCAGGDVKSVYQSGVSDPRAAGHGQPGLASADFFRYEYAVNHKLATLSTSSLATTAGEGDSPTVLSFWDGLVMGGGVGISIYGKYRIATDRTVWAMPETAIGLYPDVGSLYWMPRLLDSSMAVYLALSGRRLKAPDLLYTGLATHYVKSEQLPGLEAALVEASTQEVTDNTDPWAPVLMSFQQIAGESELARDEDAIQRSFGPALNDPNYRVEDIMAALEEDRTDFGRSTKSTLEKMSPTSLKVTLEGLRRGAAMPSITEDLHMEFRAMQACLRPRKDGGKPDFYEGIRAALVDKDQNPKWEPARLEDVSDEWVASFFEPVAHEWEAPAPAGTSTSTNSKL
jgi:enoyl-CoA hydratase/carnithine racemase